ncbi:MAG: hypothetical protein KBE04_11505 [Phycisphaerae bacterium]|nr:hypothetical protein [Phycisphaerae bacterium]
MLCMACGCQINNSTREVRSDEQMLAVSFENARAEDLFVKAVKTTYGEVKTVRRVGFPSLSLYSRGETVAWNANCNDHIRKMDKDGNLLITEQEAESYYRSIISATGKD